ncbi:hypothetical protein KXD40_002823 [Peronospora effusa]|nr:hypothetical protein KXD40_002823 [Peronospora effusa]
MDDKSKGPLTVSQQMAMKEKKTQESPCSGRLFVVCGRNRQVDELRTLFSTCGAIKHLHLALDRSKKSRYEDPLHAIVAMEKLDHIKLDDGHILKVTVAKERPVGGGNGKLKRDQHARQDLDEKIEGKVGEDDGGSEVRLPGKRQRSSRSVVTLPLGPSRVTSSHLLEKYPLPAFQADGVKMEDRQTKTMRTSQLPLSPAEVGDDEMIKVDVDLKQVEQVMRAMLLAVEKYETSSEARSGQLFTTYQQMVSMPSRESKQKEAGNVSVGFLEEPEGENSTESLASSIRSVSLVSKRMTARGSLLDPPQTPRATTRNSKGVALRRPNHHLRRRRQSLDSSGSSTGDASDGSGVRRKRSNTTTSPSHTTFTAHFRAKSQPLSPPGECLDRSDVSPDALITEIAPKKQCKRQSSDNEIEEPYRLAKQQATQERRAPDGFMVDRGHARPIITDIDKRYGEDRGMKLQLKLESTEQARTKLFFTSTCKFTEQELEAMFVVYGDFESAQLVRSFGRVKTMAYIRYSKPCTAAFVVDSFREESSHGDADPEQPEFMTVRERIHNDMACILLTRSYLSFAHETGGLQLHAERALGCSSSLHPSLPKKSVPSTPTSLPSVGKDRLWVLLLYDRFLATHMLSSVVSSLPGMEFMDIKVVKSTGEAQGVAFAKFDCDTRATQAALQLHQMELPLGSGKFLQAIVILAPSLFSTTHGNNSIGTHESLRLDYAAGERVVTGSSEDVDLRAVEARFAHLMRSTELPYTREGPYFHNYASLPFPRGATPGDQQSSPMAAGVYPPHPGEFHMGLSTGRDHYPMQYVTYPPPPPPQQSFQAYANFWPGNNYQQQLSQHREFVGNASGWMETVPYYQDGAQQYPMSCALGQEMALPVVDNLARGPDSFAVSPKPLFPPSKQMDAEDAKRKCKNQVSCSIHVSTSEPLELVTLVSAFQDCPGVVSFEKDTVAESETTGYMVHFSNEAQALEAQRKLNGIMCGGQMLRAAKNTLTRQRGSGKARTGRRKRQRVDPRTRK